MTRFTAEAGAALVFLIGYVLVYLWMLFSYLTHLIKWRSRYSLLFFHVTIRVASQACGVVFGILGFANMNVFLAYLILGAEGYFTLVLCAFRFLVSWHQHNLPSHESWLEPRKESLSRDQRLRKVLMFIFLGPLTIIFYWREPIVIMHSLLVLANVAIVFGGSYLAGADYTHPDDPDTKRRLNIAKITRTSGQSVFLACNVGLLIAILITVRGERKRGVKVHPTLLLLLLAWFPLIIRGIFGVLQSGVWSLSYYNVDNYTSEGFSSRFTALEYILGVLTEWLACVLLNITYFTSKGDPSKNEILRSPKDPEIVEMKQANQPQEQEH